MWSRFIRWLARDEIERVEAILMEHCHDVSSRSERAISCCGMALKALLDIAAMETPGANATVRRMAATARRALEETSE